MKELKRIIREKMEEYYNAAAEYIEEHCDELISILADATGTSQCDVENLDDHELLDIAHTAVNYD